MGSRGEREEGEGDAGQREGGDVRVLVISFLLLLKKLHFVSVTCSQDQPAQPVLRVGDLSKKCHRQTDNTFHVNPRTPHQAGNGLSICRCG